MKSQSKSIFNIFTLFALLASLISSAVFVTPVYAASFVVTKTADTADGTCNADCSLREAIIAANAAAGDDTITVPAGTYTLTIAGKDENAAATGDLDITSNITINGVGAGSTIIEGGTSLAASVDMVFHVPGASMVNISGVTVRNGKSGSNGGGINNAGTLAISNSTFSGNSATGFYGGGIDSSGTLTITNSTFSGNSATYGGGISNTGTLTITNSTFSTNSAAIDGGGIYNVNTLTVTNSTFSGNSTTTRHGGGIYNTGGTVTITNSTFSGNSASGGSGGGIFQQSGTLTTTDSTFSGNSASGGSGGGIYIEHGTATISNSTFSSNTGLEGGGIKNNGTMTVSNSTFSGNSATGAAGGISNDVGTLTISNSTFSGNSAANAGGIYNGSTLIITNSTFSANSSATQGGGIRTSGTATITNSTFSGNSASGGAGLYRSGGTVTVKNTIVANSTSGGNCLGTITDGGNNLQFGGSTANSCGAGIPTANPALDSLADNGGPTLTIALLAGSSAINAGDDTICGAAPVNNLDQRGFARGLNGPHCDIGAYEYQDNTAPTVISNSLATSYTTGPSSFTVTFGENVYDPAGDTDTDDVTNPNNYLLVEDGVNETFNTLSCIGSLVADDTQVTVTSVTYIPNTSIINFGSALPAGTYRLFVCGTTSIVDLALNPINGGTDTIYNFVVAPGTTTAASLPKTGFAPHKVTSLPAQPAKLAYPDLGSLWLEIPSQDIKSAIVGVPKTENGWDTTWLANDTGWLNGTAFPTWEGNSVLTAHVYDANGLPGPFVSLKELKYGDQIIVHLYDEQYIFEVRSTRLARPTTTSFALEHLEDYAFLTLITCQGYNPLSDSYLFRRIVRAVLVDVK